jgi:GTP cyclohydrolase I
MTVTSLPRRSPVRRHGVGPDLAGAERAARALMRALGVDPDDPARPDLALTPRRLAAAYAELLTPNEFEFTTFANDEGYDELVLVRDIPVQSVCEHHLLPFVGRAHLAYLPAERIVGLSKLARLVDHYARGPQTQERLTTQIASGLEQRLAPRGVGVVIEAEHTCMSLRGARAHGAATVTSSMLGHLRNDAASRAELMSLVRPGSR